MKETLIRSINHISKKRKIKYSFDQKDKLIATYTGFNNTFAEFIDILLSIDENEIIISIIPKLTFEYLDIVKVDGFIKMMKRDDNKLELSMKINRSNDFEKDLEYIYSLVFSKNVSDIYFSLIIKDWHNRISQ